MDVFLLLYIKKYVFGCNQPTVTFLKHLSVVFLQQSTMVWDFICFHSPYLVLLKPYSPNFPPIFARSSFLAWALYLAGTRCTMSSIVFSYHISLAKFINPDFSYLTCSFNSVSQRNFKIVHSKHLNIHRVPTPNLTFLQNFPIHLTLLLPHYQNKLGNQVSF
jgi:hypothetical protein